jgi:hypothetical protein
MRILSGRSDSRNSSTAFCGFRTWSGYEKNRICQTSERSMSSKNLGANLSFRFHVCCSYSRTRSTWSPLVDISQRRRQTRVYLSRVSSCKNIDPRHHQRQIAASPLSSPEGPRIHYWKPKHTGVHVSFRIYPLIPKHERSKKDATNISNPTSQVLSHTLTLNLFGSSV